MSEKSRINRAKREKKQQEKGEKIIRWIFGVLVVMAIGFMIYSIAIFS